MPYDTGHQNERSGHDLVEELSDTLHSELMRQARRIRRQRNAGETMSTTAVVHEAYVRLARLQAWQRHDRGHLLAIAAKAMRSVIVDYARRRLAAKRGKGNVPLELHESMVLFEKSDLDIIALDEALSRLEAQDRRKAQVVELRFWAGLSVPEVANVLGISIPTVERDWRFSKAWLRNVLRGKHSPDQT